MATEYPWIAVSGYGAHIKATRKTLIIQKNNTIEEYPIPEVKNLLIMGGHTLHSAAVQSLLRQGACISFFEADGTPAGTIRPPGDQDLSEMYELQKAVPRQRFATALAQTSVQARLFLMEREEELKNVRLFYEGELEFLRNSREELAFLIKIDEIRRLHRMVSDMYYEIMSRSLPPELGFRRRSMRPHADPVNAMLSFGYALLFGNCMVASVGARLDPDGGFLHDGKNSLIRSRPSMIAVSIRMVFTPLNRGYPEKVMRLSRKAGTDPTSFTESWMPDAGYRISVKIRLHLCLSAFQWNVSSER